MRAPPSEALGTQLARARSVMHATADLGLQPCDVLDGKYVDYNLYGTMNFGRHVAAHAGYRSILVDYTSSSDTANLRLKGLYFGGNFRF